MTDAAGPGGRARLPFPQSLCHACAAPPRYVTSDRGSVFIHCPLLARYPAQPVLACDRFVPADAGREGSRAGDGE